MIDGVRKMLRLNMGRKGWNLYSVDDAEKAFKSFLKFWIHDYELNACILK